MFKSAGSFWGHRIGHFVFNHRNLVNVLKTGITGGLVYLVVFINNVPYGLWIVVTVFVVMGPIPQLGGAINQGINRIYGTVVGGILGFLVFYLFGHAVVIDAFFVLLAMLFFSLITFPHTPQATIVAVITFILVVGMPHGNVEIALWRSGNVALGGLIGLISTYIFFPIFASRDFYFYSLKIIRDITQLYAMQSSEATFDIEKVTKELQAILVKIKTQNTLIKDAKRESKAFRKHLKIFNQVVTYERRLLSILELLFDAPLSKNNNVNINLEFSLIKEQQISIVKNCQCFVDALEKQEEQEWHATKFNIEGLLKQLKESSDDKTFNTGLGPYAYVWLNYQFALQFKSLRQSLIRLYLSS